MTAAIEALIADLDSSAATDRRCADKEEARDPPRYDRAIAYRYSATASEHAAAALRSILARHDEPTGSYAAAAAHEEQHRAQPALRLRQRQEVQGVLRQGGSMIDKVNKIVSITVGLLIIGLAVVTLVDRATCQRWETVPGEMQPAGGCSERCEPVNRCVQRRQVWPWKSSRPGHGP